MSLPVAHADPRPSDPGATPLQIAVAVSIGLHLLALLLVGLPVKPTGVGSNASPLPLDLAKLETVSVSDNGVFRMEGLSADDQASHRLARVRREAYLAYLDLVSDAIHRHRLDSGDTTLIGLVLFSFDINASGHFERITLRRSSGDPTLDMAAHRAILAASGEIKRPKILGDKTLTIFQEIRFQYSLQ